MKYIYLSCLMVTFFSCAPSMHRNLSQEDMSAIKAALQGYGITYQEGMPTIKKPLMPQAEVNYGNRLFLIDLTSKQVVKEYAVHARPATS